MRGYRLAALMATAAIGALLAACGASAPVAPSPAPAAPPSQPADDPGTTTPPARPPARPEPPPASPAPQPDDTPAAAAPMRGVWIHLFDDTLLTPEAVATLVADADAAGVTDLFVQVARRHDAYYTATALPSTNDPRRAPDHDVLAEVLRRAHAVGIAVHAWISVAPTWHEVYRDIPPPPGWIHTTRGLAAPPAERWVTRTADGTWRDQLDLGVPAVHDHVVGVVTDIATRYAVDGIHLDYVRYSGTDHGYHPTALARYAADTGATGPPTPTDPDWISWRQHQGSALVARVHAALAALERPVLLSAAVVTWGAGPTEGRTFGATRPATEALQDWPHWVRAGLVDLVVPMNYFREHEPEHAAWRRQWLAFQQDLATTHGRVVAGVGGWLNHPDAVRQQVAEADAATGGVVLYSYQQPADTPTPLAELLADLASTAPRPSG